MLKIDMRTYCLVAQCQICANGKCYKYWVVKNPMSMPIMGLIQFTTKS